MQMSTNRPLSPECLVRNVKYQFICKGFRYVGYFHQLSYCGCHRNLCPMQCVFTYKRNGNGGVIYANAPALITDLAFAPGTKSGVTKAKVE